MNPCLFDYRAYYLNPISLRESCIHDSRIEEKRDRRWAYEKKWRGSLVRKSRYMHSNPTATPFSLLPISCRMAPASPFCIQPVHFHSFSLPLSLSLFLFLPFCTWLHSRYYIARAKYGALSEKDERIAFHYTHTRVTHVPARRAGKGRSTQVTRTFRLDPTHPGSAFYPIPGYLRLDDFTVKSETSSYLAFIANGQTARAMQLL